MIDPQRLLAAMERKKWSQSRLAREVGVSSTMVNKLVHGGARETAHIYAFAKALDVTPEYLSGDSEDSGPSVGEPRQPYQSAKAEPTDTVDLQEFDVSYGLGASFIHDAAVTGRKRVFSRTWIRQFTESPFDHLFWGTGIGDSMTPTIQDADVVLIDTYDRTPMFWDKLWAVEVGGLGAIKRLRPTRDGAGMRLLSSNPDVPEEVVFDGEMQVIGRVVAVVRKV